jgi:hypothetical protein
MKYFFLFLYVWAFPILFFPELKAQVKVEMKQSAVLEQAADASYSLEGYLRKRIDKSIKNYLLEIPESSPTILQILPDRDRVPDGRKATAVYNTINREVSPQCLASIMRNHPLTLLFLDDDSASKI